MSLTRRRSDRPGPATRRGASRLEELETRQLLAVSFNNYLYPSSGFTATAAIAGGKQSYYNPDNTTTSVKPGNVPVPIIGHPIGIGDQTLASLGNEGKSVTGQDRAGNVYTITVYGPGQVIVSDATPNDGVLDDDIATIQLVGTDPNRTHVIGQVVASQTTDIEQSNPFDQQVTAPSGEVLFNQLIAQKGVGSITLNGFVLAQTVTPPNNGLPNSGTGIFLFGGARNLSFSGVIGQFDLGLSAAPINIMDGDPNNPLPFKPNIRIDSINNTVFNSTSTTTPTGPQTTPTIDLQVNGTIHSLQLGSVTQASEPGSSQFFFPTVGTTGRTAVQTKGIDTMVVSGSAINFTVSQTPQPFTNAVSGVNHIGTAIFGGNADAVALDSAGKIGTLEFAQGLGSPVGLNLVATDSGTPTNLFGYPANGLLGGLVTASSIGNVIAAPSSVTFLTNNNPADIQTLPGFTKYYGKAGKTLNYAGITATGSINGVNVVGDSTQSEIKAGYNLNSALQGQQANQGTSHISNLRIRGDLVDSPVSASYRPGVLGYGAPGSVPGTGSITGKFLGRTYLVGHTTALGNIGSGFFAKYKSAGLP